MWVKLGLIFEPAGHISWMKSHAANPTPLVLDENRGLVRVFFTSRNSEQQSSIGYTDIEIRDNQSHIINVSPNPIVEPGKIGLFDDSGAAMGCIFYDGNQYYLFYLGWNLKVTVPWMNTIGLAIAQHADGPYFKFSQVPVMDRSAEDPYSISYPCIIKEGAVYKMWYGSNLNWGKDQSEMQHVIKYAESTDLINWNRTNEIHIPLIHPGEYALSKPWVIKDKNLYKMWYSYRGNGNIVTYRIGYAESVDGIIWERKDSECGIDVSESGWDSEMICYASIFKLKNEIYMLYNGNGYGKTGFGIAKWI
jgi:hypothetical protein